MGVRFQSKVLFRLTEMNLMSAFCGYEQIAIDSTFQLANTIRWFRLVVFKCTFFHENSDNEKIYCLLIVLFIVLVNFQSEQICSNYLNCEYP